MARGWESKSVEDQINAREAAADDPQKTRVTAEEAETRAKREGLMLARTRTLAALQMACDSRYRAHLQRVLEDLESQLAALESSHG